MSIYNVENGKEVKNITYKQDGCTISSVREYDTQTGQLLSVMFMKEDDNSISSIIEYDNSGNEIQFSLYCDDGEIISAAM